MIKNSSFFFYLISIILTCIYIYIKEGEEMQRLGDKKTREVEVYLVCTVQQTF